MRTILIVTDRYFKLSENQALQAIIYIPLLLPLRKKLQNYVYKFKNFELTVIA